MDEPIAAAKPRSRRLLVVAMIAAALLTVAVGGRYLLLGYASTPLDPAPPPRRGLNAPFIVTPDRVVEEMVKLAKVTEDDLVYDLGCGDGRLVVTAAMRSGCRGVGFDIEPERVKEATENAQLHDVADRVKIVEQDVFTIDLSEADVCLMYLLPWMVNKLLPQFQEMAPGSRIVAHDFWIDGVIPEKIVEIPKEGGDARIYLYVAPLRLDPTMEKGKPPRIENLVILPALGEE